MLIDTDILIDIQRHHPPAVAWITSISVLPGVPGFAAIEVLDGCRDRAAWEKA
jgi:hypothetical protein